MTLHEDTVYVGLYSLLDDDRDLAFERIPRHTEHVSAYRGDPVLERLFWFSRGYYTVSEQEGVLVFHDLRFGRTDLWLGEAGDYTFSFELLPKPDAPEQLLDFRQQFVGFEADASLLDQYKRRLLGKDEQSRSAIHPAVLR
jgi:inner membrane protein